MNVGIYFTPEELEFIKSKGEGYVRSLVLDAMANEDTIKREPTSKKVIRKEKAVVAREETKEKVISVKGTSKGDGLRTCKTCGYMLFTFKGKCPNGCK